MDQKKFGRFLAQLRKEKNLTQEALGQKLGVTNKTISRWENGNYMPDIEMLKLLSEEFDVSMNELVSGERIPSEEFRKKADANLVEVLQNSSFTAKERMDFWAKKWRKEHFALIAICVLIFLAVLIVALVKRWSLLVSVLPVIVLIVYAVLKNREMIYVEARVYGSTPVAEEKAKLH
jgi:transcriptional regulator with XRE-family HTH domain